MWEIVHQKMAWEGDKSYDIRKKKDAGARPPITTKLVKDLIEASWRQKPEERFFKSFSILTKK